MAQPDAAAVGAPVQVSSNAPEDIFAEELKAFGLDDDDDDDGDDADATADDDAAEADDADADEDATGDEPASPAIDAPVSWSADDKAMFAKLPPEAQSVIAERESQRDKFVQSKATEAADAKRATAQAEGAIGQLTEQYNARLQTFLASTEPQRPDPAWLNVSVYGDEGPQAFYAAQATYEADTAQRQKAQQESANIGAWQAQQAQQAQQAFLAEQSAILAEKLPGWNDPVRHQAIAKAVTDMAGVHGYTPERLASADAADILFLHTASQWQAKADRWDDLQKDKMGAVRAAKDLPKAARPGVATQKVAANDRRERAAMDELRTTGRTSDAAALFERYI